MPSVRLNHRIYNTELQNSPNGKNVPDNTYIDSTVADGCQVCLRRNERIQHHGQCVILHRCLRPRTNQEHRCGREHLSSLPCFFVHLLCPSPSFTMPISDCRTDLFLWNTSQLPRLWGDVRNLEVHSFQCYIVFFVYFEQRSYRTVSCAHKKV